MLFVEKRETFTFYPKDGGLIKKVNYSKTLMTTY